MAADYRKTSFYRRDVADMTANLDKLYKRLELLIEQGAPVSKDAMQNLSHAILDVQKELKQK